MIRCLDYFLREFMGFLGGGGPSTRFNSVLGELACGADAIVFASAPQAIGEPDFRYCPISGDPSSNDLNARVQEDAKSYHLQMSV